MPAIPVCEPITPAGSALPATNEYGMDTEIYLDTKDTGQWHTLATFNYTGSTSNPVLYGPTVNPRVVPGIYDIYYCHRCNASGNVSYETDATDAFPRGLRVLQSGVTVAPGTAHLDIDIPVIPVSETIILAGSPLPATNEYGMDTEIYLVARDTGQWHTLATFNYTGSTSNPMLYGPTVNPRVVP